jgi:transcriptional regulator with XRE-family HTH domain
MIIGERLKILRESKKLSQGDMEKRTGLLRCYTSRVENGHTVPSVETLGKYAHALEIPLYRLFYEETGTPTPLHLPRSSESGNGVNPDEWRKFVHHLGRMNAKDRRTLYFMAQKMARPQRPQLRSGRKASSKRAR